MFCIKFLPTYICNLKMSQDQIDHLQKLKIPADTINSRMANSERERVVADLRSVRTDIKFLYVTPEQAATSFFKVCDIIRKWYNFYFIRRKAFNSTLKKTSISTTNRTSKLLLFSIRWINLSFIIELANFFNFKRFSLPFLRVDEQR